MRILAGSLAICAFAALIAAALPRGLADLRAFEARQFIRNWENKAAAAPAADWERARDALLQARELYPRHPGYLEDLALLYEYRGLRAAPDPAREDFGQALDLVRWQDWRFSTWHVAWDGWM
jgi:hypothetical protein